MRLVNSVLLVAGVALSLGSAEARADVHDTGCAPPKDRSQVGILTRQLRDNGFYEDGPPRGLEGPALFPADVVAAGSAACTAIPGTRPAEWAGRQEACARQGGYQNVHLYVSLGHDISDEMAAQASQVDPWWRDKRYKDRVFLVRTDKEWELQGMIGRLLLACKVVSYVYVSSHGSAGRVDFGASGKGADGKPLPMQDVTIGSFMRNGLSPCVLAPGAHVQFDGCNIACGSAAEASRLALSSVLNGHTYDPNWGKPGLAHNDPFHGVEFYFNTSTGWNAPLPGFIRALGFNARSYSVNGIGDVISRQDGGFVSDIPAGRAPACTEYHAFPLNDFWYDWISKGN